MSNDMVTAEKVGDFYNNSQFTQFWEKLHKRHMHVGYWDEDNSGCSIYEGSKRLTDMMIDWHPVRKGERFIDIGCGFGVPGVGLVEERGCELVGITASEYQCGEANKLALEKKVSEKAEFIFADARELPFEDNSFDHGWFFESIFHMGHHEALKEARRVLKPEGIITIADFIKLDSLNSADEQYIKDVFFVQQFLRYDDYFKVLRESGFECLEIKNIGKEAMVTWAKYVQAALDNRSFFVDIGGEEFANDQMLFWKQVSKIMTGGFSFAYIKARCIK